MRTLLKRLVIIAVVAVVIGVVAYQLLPPSEAGRTAVAQLAKANKFSFGGGGIAGSIQESENWFFAILSSRHSARLFHDLFKQSTTAEARLYALAGLHLTDKDNFRVCAARFVKESSRVQTLGGCIAHDCTPAEAIASIERGDVERYLKLRKEYVRAR